EFQRTVIRTVGQAEEYLHLTHHLDDLQAGRIVIMVLARHREQRMTAADILNAHGADFVGFYGRWAWEALPPDASGSEADADRERQMAARRPDEIPLLFADAWNARDPDALASLFDEDAEFVNVTGRWWHDRAAVRSA